MSTGETVTHPWMANSVAAIKELMLAEIGAVSIEELFAQIPAGHRLRRPLDLPPGLRAEADLRRHLTTLLKRNETCEDHLNFLGAGCWQHHVPAVVDEIVGRNEFLTNVWGTPSPIPAATRPGSSLQASSASWSAWRSSRCRSILGAVLPATRSAWPRGSPGGMRCSCRASPTPSGWP